MSSYFDRLAACAQDPLEVARLAFDQFGRHLQYVDSICLVKDVARLRPFIERHNAFRAKLDEVAKIEDRGERQYRADFLIQDMHSLAHEIGSAGIALRGGRRLLDNPVVIIH